MTRDDDTLRSASKRVSRAIQIRNERGQWSLFSIVFSTRTRTRPLSVVRRMGYEEGSRTDSGNTRSCIIRTRVDLGILFDSKRRHGSSSAKLNLRDWEFKTVGNSDVNQDILFHDRR